MPELDLAALRAENAERRKLKGAATLGPWHVEPCLRRCEPPTSFRPEDAVFIVAARSDPVEDRIDSLLDAVERLREHISDAQLPAAFTAQDMLGVRQRAFAGTTTRHDVESLLVTIGKLGWALTEARMIASDCCGENDCLEEQLRKALREVRGVIETTMRKLGAKHDDTRRIESD